MRSITNEYLKKEIKKVNLNLIIGLVCVILSFTCIGLGFYESNKKPKDSTYLNDVITRDNNKTDVTAHLKLTIKPVSFATMSNNTQKKLYMASDGEYYYIIELTNKEFDKIDKHDFEEPFTIYGKTKTITSDIKSLAKASYNEIANEDNKITDDKSFYGMFGDIYLDATEQGGAEIVLFVISAITAMISTYFIIIFGVMKFKVVKALKEIDDEELQKIESEMEDKEAFHYEKARLILTKNYIVSFLNDLKVLKYEDIIWIYEYRLRQYGITTQKSIMVMDKTGKVKPIITLDRVTKKSKLVFDEIADTILSKNDKILVGYNKENRKKIKEEYNFNK